MLRLLLLFCFAIPSTLLATHIVGGEVSYTYLGNDEYEIVLTVYRDCGPTNPNQTDFDNPAYFGIYDNGNLNNPYLNLSISLSDAIIDEIPANTLDPCLLIPPELCVERARYFATATLPSSQDGYSMVYQRCCRNNGLVNITSNDDVGGTYWAQIPPSSIAPINSNPVFTELPPLAICANEPFVFDHSATDLDGDSLVYSICTPLDNEPFEIQPTVPAPPPYDPIIWNPGFDDDYQITSDPAIVIDSETGVITGTPTFPGAFVFGVCVQEYRNGVLLSETNRDFQITVTICGVVNSDIGNTGNCDGLDVAFTSQSNGAQVYQWDFGVEGDDTDVSDVENPTYTYPDFGEYEVTLITDPGTACADTTVETIEVLQPIVLDATISGGECVPGGRLFTITDNSTFPAGTNLEWTFSPGTTPPSFSGPDPGDILASTSGNNVIILNASNPECDDVFSIEFPVDPYPTASFEAPSTSCGELDIPFTSNMQNQIEFQWDFGHAFNNIETEDENPIHTFPGYGTYEVNLVVDPGTTCADTATSTIEISDPNPILLSFAIQDPGPCSADSTINGQFTGEGADLITWEFSDGQFVEGDEFEIEFENSGWYDITISAYHEICDLEVSETSTIYYEADPIVFPLELPNVFSPNGDGRNEFYRPFFAVAPGVPYEFPGDLTLFDYLTVWEMQIYNRWGALVFDTADGLKQWDGNSDGNELSDGTFYAIITYQRTCVDLEPQTVGMSFELLR